MCAGLKVECKDTAFEDAGLGERDGLLLGELDVRENHVAFICIFFCGILWVALILQKAAHRGEYQVDISTMPRSFDDSIINREIYNLCNCVVIVNNTQFLYDPNRQWKEERIVSYTCQVITLHGCCERSSLPVITDGVMHSRVFIEVIQGSFWDVVDHGLGRVYGSDVHGDGQFYCPCSLCCLVVYSNSWKWRWKLFTVCVDSRMTVISLWFSVIFAKIGSMEGILSIVWVFVICMVLRIIIDTGVSHFLYEAYPCIILVILDQNNV